MKLGVTLDILNQKDTPAFYADTLANRPAAGFTGRVFISTDTLDLYRDTGTTWVLLSPSSTGTITGSGAAGQVTFFSSASSITGTNDLFYDSGNNRLGINTNAPTAPLDVHSSLSGALMQLNQTSGILDSQIAFQSANVGKWRIGSYYNSGQYSFGIYDVFNSRERFSVLNTGQTFVGDQVSSSGKLVVNSGSLGDTGLVVISSSSPSIRINNGGTGANFRCGLGISTAANNFIQGSVDGDFCIFNSNTGTFPILFGINDTGLGNTQEAARVSAARNFLIGTTTDAGQKLQVSGTSLITGAASFSSTLTTNNTIQTNVAGGLAYRAYFGSGNNLSLDVNVDSSNGDASLTFNTTFNAGYKYFLNNFAARISNAGTLKFQVAPIGTAGSTISWVDALSFSNTSGAATFRDAVTGRSYGVNNGTFRGGLYSYTDILGSGSDNSITIFSDNPASGGNIYFCPQGGATRVASIIGSTGNLLIGTTTDNGNKLQVNGFANFQNPASNSGNGGFEFFTKRIQAGITTSFYQVPSANWGGITEITWVSSADSNRSGAALLRWAYDIPSATTGVVFTAYSNNQNAVPTFSFIGGSLFIDIAGGSADYYVQFRIQGSQAV